MWRRGWGPGRLGAQVRGAWHAGVPTPRMRLLRSLFCASNRQSVHKAQAGAAPLHEGRHHYLYPTTDRQKEPLAGLPPSQGRAVSRAGWGWRHVHCATSAPDPSSIAPENGTPAEASATLHSARQIESNRLPLGNCRTWITRAITTRG